MAAAEPPGPPPITTTSAVCGGGVLCFGERPILLLHQDATVLGIVPVGRGEEDSAILHLNPAFAEVRLRRRERPFAEDLEAVDFARQHRLRLLLRLHQLLVA